MARLRREFISPDPSRSFRLLLTPHLEDVFLWHYHPEYEIVFIDGASGNRHIGEHLERYEGKDLSLIGPFVPHLNFDYGVSPNHEKIVVQFREDFLGAGFLGKPELSAIRQLLNNAAGAACFHGDTLNTVGEMMRRLPHLSPFRQLIQLLDILQIMAESSEIRVLNQSRISGEQEFREQARMKRIEAFVATHYQEPIAMTSVLEMVNLSDAAFCRWFKKLNGVTFTEYVSKYRIVRAKQELLQGASVTEACYASGFGHLSHFNKTFRKHTGINPIEFRQMGGAKK